jgi:hypothetical protein
VLVKIRNIELSISDLLAKNKRTEVQDESRKTKTDDLKDIRDNVADIADNLSHRNKFDEAAIALAPDAVPSDWMRGIEALKSVLRDEPDNRRAAIWLGRLYRKMSEQGVEQRQYINEAIGTLTRFLEVKERRRQDDEDVADALYNRACYKIRKGDYVADGNFLEDVGNARDISDGLYKDGITDLRRSVELKVLNAVDAINDRDFDTVRSRADFQKLSERALLPRA